jgi:hypothetical protein
MTVSDMRLSSPTHPARLICTVVLAVTLLPGVCCASIILPLSEKPAADEGIFESNATGAAEQSVPVAEDVEWPGGSDRFGPSDACWRNGCGMSVVAWFEAIEVAEHELAARFNLPPWMFPPAVPGFDLLRPPQFVRGELCQMNRFR